MKTTKIVSIVVAALLAFTIAGCSSDNNGSTESPTPVAESPSPEETEADRATTAVPTFDVGNKIFLPSATFTVTSIEKRDVIESEFPDMQPNYEPKDGGSLWLLTMEWKNTTDEVVYKGCFGPDMFDLRVFDVDGVEMAEVEQPGYIKGTNCDQDLMKGDTATWMTAFYSKGDTFGWAEFEDYAGDNAIVVADPDLELNFTD